MFVGDLHELVFEAVQNSSFLSFLLLNLPSCVFNLTLRKLIFLHILHAKNSQILGKKLLYIHTPFTPVFR